MKRHIQKTGIRKYFGKDFTELQGEPLKALDGFFAEYGACIITGCEITAASGKYDVSAGLVALEATDPETGVSDVKVMPFDGATGVTLPLYLSASATPVERVYGDGKVKPIAYDYRAVGATVRPSGAYLAVTTDGGNRFVDTIQDPEHRFASDTEKTAWNAKETPTGAQTKATAAETNSKAYTDTRETAIRQTITSGDSSTLTSAKAYADTKTAEVNTSLGSHTGDATRHITAGERTAWNAKETPAGAQTKATAAETNAKAYTDTREGVINTEIGKRVKLDDARLTDARPASDVYAWAKAPAKPKYTASELGEAGCIDFSAGQIVGMGKMISSAFDNEDTAVLSTSSSGVAVLASPNDPVYMKWASPYPRYKIWHAGNFNPASKADASHVSDSVKHITARERDIWNESMINRGVMSIDVDIDTLNSTGYYFVMSPYAGTLIVTAAYKNYAHPMQILIPYNRSGMLTRSYNTNAKQWSEWVEMWHSGNFDPASKLDTAGGTITGPVWMRYGTGSTAIGRDLNGCYIENADDNDVTITQLRLRDDGRATIYNNKTKVLSDIWDSSNFNPAAKINYTDLMYPDGDFAKPSATNTGATALGSRAVAQMYKSTAIGHGAEAPVANSFQLGGSNVSSLNCVRALTVTSDARDKTNIRDMDSDTAERLIMSLRPVEFNRNDRGDYQTEGSLLDEVGNIVNYDHAAHAEAANAGARTNIGLIAQEVQSSLIEITGGDAYGALVSDTAHGTEVAAESSRLGIAYQNLIAPMISVVQKLSARIDRQDAEIERLKNILQDNIASTPKPEPTPEQPAEPTPEPEQPAQPEIDSNTQTDNTENTEK